MAKADGAGPGGAIIEQLVAMGLGRDMAGRACEATGHTGVQDAIRWSMDRFSGAMQQAAAQQASAQQVDSSCTSKPGPLDVVRDSNMTPSKLKQGMNGWPLPPAALQQRQGSAASGARGGVQESTVQDLSATKDLREEIKQWRAESSNGARDVLKPGPSDSGRRWSARPQGAGISLQLVPGTPLGRLATPRPRASRPPTPRGTSRMITPRAKPGVVETLSGAIRAPLSTPAMTEAAMEAAKARERQMGCHLLGASATVATKPTGGQRTEARVSGPPTPRTTTPRHRNFTPRLLSPALNSKILTPFALAAGDTQGGDIVATPKAISPVIFRDDGQEVADCSAGSKAKAEDSGKPDQRSGVNCKTFSKKIGQVPGLYHGTINMQKKAPPTYLSWKAASKAGKTLTKSSSQSLGLTASESQSVELLGLRSEVASLRAELQAFVQTASPAKGEAEGVVGRDFRLKKVGMYYGGRSFPQDLVD